MSRTIADEREHRRGLVLGLTLAELLLLLLFLLLLALGSRLERAEARANDIDQVRDLIDEMRASGKGDLEVDLLIERLARLDALEAEATALRAENAKLETELQSVESDLGGDLASIRSSVSSARKINPDDPPAVLERALAVLNILGADVQPDDVRPLSEMIDSQEAGANAQAEAEPQTSDGHQWPPIINLSEADGHFFDRGRSNLTPEFQERLIGDVVPRLLEIAGDYDVNVIEVVGHTDEQPIAPRPSNLDQKLTDVLHRKLSVEALVPADNAGLGLARAAAVVSALSVDSRLQNLRILPLSGGQLITTEGILSDGTMTGDVRERRRIEIRMRGSE